MEDLTKRIITALRKAVQNARNADDAAEAAALADFVDAHSTPITVVPATAEIRADDTPGVIMEAAPDQRPAKKSKGQ